MSHRISLCTIIAACLLLAGGDTAGWAQEVKADEHEVKPLQVLTRDNLILGAEVGIGIAVSLNPETKVVKEAFDVSKIVLDQSVKSVEFRDSVLSSHLLVVNAEIERLRSIDVHSPEAQAILANLRREHFSTDSTGMFLAKSVFSLRMVYGVASQYATKKLSGKIAENFARKIPLGNKVEYMWIGKKGLIRANTNIPWSHLKELGENSRLLTNAFRTVVLKKIGERIGRYAVESMLDKAVEDILRGHPSIPEAVYTLRVDAMVRPELLAPIAAAQPAMVPAAVAMPPVILAQPDPVIRAASVQQQVVAAQHHESSSTARSGGGSNYDPPVERHPTHNLPSSINIGGSFTGGSGSTLFTRF